MLNFVTLDILIFTGVQFINVIVSTIKSVATIKSSPSIAAAINAISYTISAIITKFITQQSFEIVIVVTLITNLIGVFIGRLLTDRLQKEKLWVYNCRLKCTQQEMINLKQELNKYNIDCIYTEIALNTKYKCEIDAHSKNDSMIIKEILKPYKPKCHIIYSVNWMEFS